MHVTCCLDLCLSVCSCPGVSACVRVCVGVSAPELDHFFADVRKCQSQSGYSRPIFRTLLFFVASRQEVAAAPKRQHARKRCPPCHMTNSRQRYTQLAQSHVQREASQEASWPPPTSTSNHRLWPRWPVAVPARTSAPACQHPSTLGFCTLPVMRRCMAWMKCSVLLALARTCSHKTGSKQHPLDCDAQLPLLSSAACKIWISSSNSAAGIRQLPDFSDRARKRVSKSAFRSSIFLLSNCNFFFTGASA